MSLRQRWNAWPAPQVFFIRDGAQFVDLIHASKPSPVNRLSPGWRLADFFSWHPETMNVVSPETSRSLGRSTGWPIVTCL